MSIFVNGKKILNATVRLGEGGSAKTIVNFYNGDMIINTQTVKDPGGVVPPENPTQESTVQYVYSFLGWSLDGINLLTSWVAPVGMREVNYHAVFEQSIRKYTIRFLNTDGTVLQETQVPYGSTPEYAGTPPSSGVLVWVGWETEIVPVTGDTDYIAAYVNERALAYTLNSAGTEYTVTGIGTIEDTDIVIPDTFQGLPVTEIGSSAFNANQTITSVRVGANVTKIGSSSFYKCPNLTEVSVSGDSLTVIGNYAFRICKALTTVILPDSVTHIYNSAFDDCESLATFNFPKSLIELSSDAFNGCESLPTIDLPQGLTEIGSRCFYWVKASGALAIPDTVTYIGEAAFHGCSNISSITIGDSVTKINKNTFNGCSGVTNLTLGSGITTIADSAFYNMSSITELVIPDSVTSIGDSAFAFAGNLKTIHIGSGLDTISAGAFKCYSTISGLECTPSIESISVDPNNQTFTAIDGKLYSKDGSSLILFAGELESSNIILPDGLTSIGTYAFYGYFNAINIEIPDTVTHIGDYAFSNCKALSNIEIPSGVTAIESSTFSSCSSLQTVVLPSAITTIGKQAFAWCTALTTIALPEELINIEEQAFYSAPLLDCVIPDKVIRIGGQNFSSECVWTSGSLTLPSTITQLGASAITSTSLTEIILQSVTPPEVVLTGGTYKYAFGSSMDATLQRVVVPAGCGDAYKAAESWSKYSDIIVEAA